MGDGFPSILKTTLVPSNFSHQHHITYRPRHTSPDHKTPSKDDVSVIDVELILIAPLVPFILFIVVAILSCIYCRIRRKRNADGQHRLSQRDTSFDATFRDYMFSFHEKDNNGGLKTEDLEMHHLPYFVEDDEFERWSDDLSTQSSFVVGSGYEMNTRQYGGVSAAIAKSIIKQDLSMSLSGMASAHAQRAPVASIEDDEVFHTKKSSPLPSSPYPTKRKENISRDRFFSQVSRISEEIISLEENGT